MQLYEKVALSLHKKNTLENVFKRIHPSAGDRSRVVDRDLNRYYNLVDTTASRILDSFSDKELDELIEVIKDQLDITAMRVASVRIVRNYVDGFIADGLISAKLAEKLKKLNDLEFISLIDHIETEVIKDVQLIKRGRKAK